MQDVTELERRISAALERIERGLDAIPAVIVPAQPDEAPFIHAEDGADAAAIAALQAQIDEERNTNAQLQERLRLLAERDQTRQAQAQDKADRLTRQLDVQGLELQRMRRTAATLREQLRQVHEAAVAGLVEPSLINKAMLTELESLRAMRLTEMAELDEIAAVLDDHLTEAENA